MIFLTPIGNAEKKRETAPIFDLKADSVSERIFGEFIYSIMTSDNECVNEYIQLNEIKSVLGKILIKQFGIMQSQAKAYKESIETNSAISFDSVKAEI